LVVRITNIKSHCQLLEKIVIGDDEIEIINNEQVKIQPRNSIANANIMKEVKNRDTEFYIYKPKQRRSFEFIPKYMHHRT